MSQCGSSVLMRSQTTKRQPKTSMHMYRTVLGASTSLCLHKSGSTGLFHTSPCRKHFDFLKVNVQVTVALDQGISRLCDLFHNLWNGNINIRRMPTSRFIRRIPASRFIRQLTHWLCMPLFSSSANCCQHRPAGALHQTCELYTQVRQSHGFSPR